MGEQNHIIKQQDAFLQYRLDEDRLWLYDALTLPVVSLFIPALFKLLRGYDSPVLYVDLNGLMALDSAGVTALQYLKSELKRRNIEVEITGGKDSTRKKLELFWHKEVEGDEYPPYKSHLETIGENAYIFFLKTVPEFFLLTIDIIYWSVADIFRSRFRRKGEFVNQAVSIGVNAVTIVGALAFIIGLVLALQSAAQLRNFGANIYIVDLTVIAMMREMGPLITAILVAGRSGSAIAAEIATMKVTSELDALTTMALNPIRFVIVPKMYGAVVTMPFLTILANVMGIFGGMIVAYYYLDLAPEVFYNRMADSLYIKDIMTGFIKSLVFAILIVLTGSYYGFNVEEGAEGVGKVTTLAVVVSISLVIVADSILGLIFY